MADVLHGTINILVAKDDGTGNPLYKPIYPKTSINQIENFTEVLDQRLDTKVNAIPNATDTERGLVVIGPNITNSAGVISITKADIESALGFTPMSQAEMASAALNAQTADTLAEPRTIDGVAFNGSSNIAHFGICSTAASTSAKSVSCSGFILGPGATITVTFTTDNTAENPTLNVNNTGPKVIQYRHANISPEVLAANRTYTFIYNGTNYQLVGDVAGEQVTFPVTGVKGETEANYRHGDINITKANLGLENVNNTADKAKSVASAAVLTNPRNISISGAVTGAATSFNGSADIDIPTTAIDVSKANAGILAVARGGTGESSLANVSVGSAARANQLTNSRNITITDGTHEGTTTAFNGSTDIKIKLPTEITATLHGKADSAAVADSCNGTVDTAKKAEQDEDGNSIKNTYAKLNSPTFTGEPKSVTPAESDSSTKIATTKFVQEHKVHYAICNTAINEQVKAVTCSDFKFVAGNILIVKFVNGNNAIGPTLNVNGTGAKAIKYRTQNNITYGQFNAPNATYILVYDGEAFQFVGDVNEQAVTGIRGEANGENEFRKGNVSIYKSDLGLGNVENTKDIEKNVATALYANSAGSATKAEQDKDGNAFSTSYAKLASPTFTGTPKLQVGNEVQNIATQNYVSTQINSALADVNVEEVKENIATLNAMLEGDGSIAGQINAKQTHSQALDDIVSAASTENQIVYSSTGNRYSTAKITSFARQILDDNDATAVRTTIQALGKNDTAKAAEEATYAETVENTKDSSTKIATTAFVQNRLQTFLDANADAFNEMELFVTQLGGIEGIQSRLDNKVDTGSSLDTIADMTNIPANKMLYTSATNRWSTADITNVGLDILKQTSKENILNYIGAVSASGNVGDADQLGGHSAAEYALLKDPVFTGDPKAPTPSATDNDTSIATTAFVHKNVVHYAVCDSSNQTEVKVVSCPNYPFTAGSILTIKFTNGNSYTSPKLNVNSTGAKAIKYRGANIKSTQMYAANGIYSFVYDGTDFHFIGDVNEQSITGIRGDSTPSNASGTNSEGYYTGKVTLSKADLGLDKVENKSDIERDVKTALRATSDKDGNQIDTTYLKVSAKANTAALADEATKAINDVDGKAIKTTYAKLASPTFTGEPKIQSGSTTSAIATQNYVTTQINSALADVNVEEVKENIATLNAMLEGDGSIAGQINSKQAHSQALDDIVSAASTANRIVYSASNSRYNAAPISSFALSILDDTSAAAVRTTIDALGKTEKAASASTADSATSATKDSSNNTITSYYAPISNPIFKNSAQAPTVTDLNDSTTKIATTAFVANKLNAWAQSNMEAVNDLQDFLDSVGGFSSLSTTIQNKLDKGSSVDSIANLTNIPANKMLYTSAKNTWSTSDFSSLSRTLAAKTTAADMLNELSTTLASIAGLSVAANQMLYTNDSKKYATTAISQVGRELLANSTKANMLSYLGAAATNGTVTNATQLENHSANYFMKRADYGSGSISTSQWKQDTTNNNYYVDIANSNISAEKMVLIICLPATESIATAAKIKPTNESFSKDSTHSTGYVRIRAEAIPTATIQIGYYIFETASSN